MEISGMRVRLGEEIRGDHTSNFPGKQGFHPNGTRIA
jgi:hypothetical protein